ncbi:hypothetical protein TPA0906_22870 [Streptomyces olivaceus]|nr:hypothetical protein TPA0905_43580 [Streptomyces olivaceus]GHJ00422.1 hypothetical protein TPA0906_22870 [Streptomyces olivaceus]
MTGHDADVAGRGARDDQSGLAGPDLSVGRDQRDVQISSQGGSSGHHPAGEPGVGYKSKVRAGGDGTCPPPPV